MCYGGGEYMMRFISVWSVCRCFGGFYRCNSIRFNGLQLRNYVSEVFSSQRQSSAPCPVLSLCKLCSSSSSVIHQALATIKLSLLSSFNSRQASARAKSLPFSGKREWIYFAAEQMGCVATVWWAHFSDFERKHGLSKQIYMPLDNAEQWRIDKSEKLSIKYLYSYCGVETRCHQSKCKHSVTFAICRFCLLLKWSCSATLAYDPVVTAHQRRCNQNSMN